MSRGRRGHCGRRHVHPEEAATMNFLIASPLAPAPSWMASRRLVHVQPRWSRQWRRRLPCPRPRPRREGRYQLQKKCRCRHLYVMWPCLPARANLHLRASSRRRPWLPRFPDFSAGASCCRPWPQPRPGLPLWPKVLGCLCSHRFRSTLDLSQGPPPSPPPRRQRLMVLPWRTTTAPHCK